MAVWTLFFSTILLPLVTIALLGRRPRMPRSAWVATCVMAAGVCGFAFFAGPWGWFGWAVRWLLPVLFVTAVIVSLRRDAVASTEESPLRMVVKVLIGILFGSVALGVLQAHQRPAQVVDVALPLRNGRFMVVHGGSSTAANMHFADPKQHFAVDLVEVNALGWRAAGIYPADLSRYLVYRKPVLSPCAGKVIGVVDGLPDQPRGLFDEKNVLGNQVVVQCGDVAVTLAQLSPGSITVKPGAAVAVGTPLAKVGNSGKTTEPHLHIQAERNGTPVGLTFNGSWLVRNAIVRN